MHNKNIEIIKGILNTRFSDADKLYFIQSYLLGWTSEESMKQIIERNMED